MPMLNAFKTDAFSTVSLTAAINKAPYQPGLLGTLGLFRESGIPTTTAIIEEIAGQLSLITSSPRGGPGTILGASKRTARSFIIPHFERESKIKADEIQGIRAFGSENELEALQPLVDDRLATLRRMHEATLEYIRAGAIQGNILDGDGASVLYNLFTEFNVTQQTKNMNFGSPTFDVRGTCVAIQRLIEAELGAETVTNYRAFCGDSFFDALVSHPNVVASFQYQEGAVLRADLRKGFEYGGITWVNYRGKLGSVSYFPDAQAFVVPEGTSLFTTNFAPADFLETANTIGLPVYAKTSFDDELNRFVKIHSQSNPLALCLRPRAVVQVTKT